MLTQSDVRHPASDTSRGWPVEAQAPKLPQHVSATEFREALSRVASAVSIVSTDGPHGIAGFTCSAVCAVSDEPPIVMVCVNRKSAANAVIKANGVLCISSLGAEQVDLSQMFAGVGRVAMPDRFSGPHWSVLSTGAPLLHDFTRRARLPGGRCQGSGHPQRVSRRGDLDRACNE